MNNVKKLYRHRFKDVGKRAQVWKILVSDFFSEYFTKNDVVLDLGSGYCEFINQIKAKSKYALDSNEDTLRFANKDVKFLHADSTKIPLNRSTIDKVFISNFFEHITRDQIIKTIAELKRILRENGSVIVLQPNIRFLEKDYWMFFDHITPIDDRALEEAFLAQGFRLNKRIEKFLPFTMNSKVPTSTFFIKVYLKLPMLWKIIGKQSLLIFEK